MSCRRENYINDRFTSTIVEIKNVLSTSKIVGRSLSSTIVEIKNVLSTHNTA